MAADELTIPNVLACDVGNTTISFAHVSAEDVTDMQTIRLDQPAELGRKLAALWSRMPQPKAIVAASVNPPGLSDLETAASETLDETVLVVGRDLPLPLPLQKNLPEPELIGVDRLCCAAAAYDRLGSACVVADFGTAITVDCVNDDGVFLGGAIMPGLSLSAKCLHTNTAQIPLVDLTEPDWVFGADTRQAVIAGIVRGARGALRALVESYAEKLGSWPVVILTGGDAELICPDLKESDLVQAVVSDLALRGAAMAYYKSLTE